MSKTDNLKNIVTTLGGDVNALPDNLKSTLYEAIIIQCGGSVDDLPDRLETTYLKRISECVSGNGTVKNQHKTFTENGVYRADEGYTGLGTVIVDVPERVPILQEKTATENGEVVADAGYDGLSKVTVNVAQTGGVNKLLQMVDGSITEITEEDLRGVTKIAYNAFRGRESLVSASIPDGVISIDRYAFSGCYALEFLTISASVTAIASNAFNGCTILKRVTVKSKTPPVLETGAFGTLSTGCVITVPTGCGDAYKSATNWSDFADKIVEEVGEGGEGVEGGWLFENAYLSTSPNTALPAPVEGVSYTVFYGETELGTSTITEIRKDAVGFAFPDYCIVYANGGWCFDFDPMSGWITDSGTVSIRINN